MSTATLDENWRLAAACRGHDPEMWSLSAGRSGTSYKQAHRICADCPVRQSCEEFAVQTGSWGLIFGGRDFTEPDRYTATPLERNCTRCDRRFTTLVAWRRFCSDTCRKLHHARLRTWTS